jgi:hypothetical protein
MGGSKGLATKFRADYMHGRGIMVAKDFYPFDKYR